MCNTVKILMLYILPPTIPCEPNYCTPTGHIERYNLTAVIPILTALLLSNLNDLKFFFVFFIYTLLEFYAQSIVFLFSFYPWIFKHEIDYSQSITLHNQLEGGSSISLCIVTGIKIQVFRRGGLMAHPSLVNFEISSPRKCDFRHSEVKS